MGDSFGQWHCGENDIYFDEDQTSVSSYFYCNRYAQYYFDQYYGCVSSIDIMDDKGTVIKHIEADAFSTESCQLSSGKLYWIRFNRESTGSYEESCMQLLRYNYTYVNSELSDYSTYVSSYEQYRFNFTAPSAGTYTFYSTEYGEYYSYETYASLYTMDGYKLTDSSADEDYNYNFSISYYLEEGQQVQLRTSVVDNYEPGWYRVSIVKTGN